MCVQRFDDSRRYAIRTTYRISLRSSSLWEPRHPLLKVVWHLRHMQGGRLTNWIVHPPAPSFRKVNVYCFVFGIVVDPRDTHLHREGAYPRKEFIHNMYKFTVIDLGDLGSVPLDIG